MNKTTAVIIFVGFFAVLGAIALFKNRKKIAVSVATRLGKATFKTENDSPPASIPAGVKIKDAEAGENIRASSSGPGGVEMEKVKAKGDIEATHSSGDSLPKK